MVNQYIPAVVLLLLLFVALESVGDILESKNGSAFFGWLKLLPCSFLLYHIEILFKLTEINP